MTIYNNVYISELICLFVFIFSFNLEYCSISILQMGIF